jgi:Flp pilus assembly protein TadD
LQVSSFKFVNFDDPDYVYKNQNIQGGITLKAIQWAFTTGHASNWHPLTWISHMLDWQMFSSKAGGHHFTNLVFHVANTLLLFLVLKQMTSASWPSAFVAALFALHPLHVESVAWISERKDVLSTFFWMLTMWAYIRFVKCPKITRYSLIIIFFTLGLMSKSMLVTLPFVLLLLDYWPLERFGLKYSIPRLVAEKIPLFVMTLASCIVTFIAQKKSGAMEMGEKYSFLIRIANASISYLQYIIKMIWPAHLAMFYPHPGRNVSIPYAVISAVLLLAATIFMLRFAKNHRYLVTGWFWYLGTLIPVIGFVQVGVQTMADRYTYITLTGLFIIIAWGIPELLEKWLHRKFLLWASSLIVLSILVVCTYLQVGYWKDTVTLCQHTIDVTKNNQVAHFSMAQGILEQGRIEDAIWHYSEAVRIKPDYIEALNNLGISLRMAGRVDEAIRYYKKALEINPRHIGANFNLGVALAAKGRFTEAISFYNKALQISPDHIEIRTSIGIALAESGKLAEAEKEYEDVLRIQPKNAVAHNALGVTLLQQEKFDEAIAHFNQAVQINPKYIVAKKISIWPWIKNKNLRSKTKKMQRNKRPYFLCLNHKSWDNYQLTIPMFGSIIRGQNYLPEAILCRQKELVF